MNQLTEYPELQLDLVELTQRCVKAKRYSKKMRNKSIIPYSGIYMLLFALSIIAVFGFIHYVNDINSTPSRVTMNGYIVGSEYIATDDGNLWNYQDYNTSRCLEHTKVEVTFDTQSTPDVIDDEIISVDIIE